MNPPLALLLLALMGCGKVQAQASPEAPPPPPAASEGWLRGNDGEALLRYLLADGVFTEAHSAQIALGVDRTCELVKPRFEKAVKDLRPEWTKMYRSASAKFPYEHGNSRRETQLFFALGLEAVDLLGPKIVEITEPALSEAAKVDFDSIDYDARFDEVENARAEGRASCGLRRIPDPSATAGGRQRGAA